jgi:hypothetical protein
MVDSDNNIYINQRRDRRIEKNRIEIVYNFFLLFMEENKNPRSLAVQSIDKGGV